MAAAGTCPNGSQSENAVVAKYDIEMGLEDGRGVLGLIKIFLVGEENLRKKRGCVE